MSLGMMVTLFAWMAHRLVSSKTSTRYASDASCSAKTALPWNLKPLLMFWAISRTSLWNGSFLIRRSVDFWYLRISLSATVPGRYRWGLLIPPCCGAAFLAAFFANAFLECPLFCRHFLAVCLVLTIVFLLNVCFCKALSWGLLRPYHSFFFELTMGKNKCNSRFSFMLTVKSSSSFGIKFLFKSTTAFVFVVVFLFWSCYPFDSAEAVRG